MYMDNFYISRTGLPNSIKENKNKGEKKAFQLNNSLLAIK